MALGLVVPWWSSLRWGSRVLPMARPRLFTMPWRVTGKARTNVNGSTTSPVSKARDITNGLPTKVNSFHRSYVESVSSVGGQLCVLMAISMALNASLASRWRRIIRLTTCSARA